ncbi:unnamed protein product, partial [marine sediment metagenome]
QEFALRYPGKVISLILGCTTPGGANSSPPTPESTAFLFDPERGKLPVEERARQTAPWLWGQEFIDNNPDVVEQYVAVTAEYPTPLHGFQRQGQAIMGHDTYDRLPQIKAPTLVIAGSADRLIQVENSRLLASRIPGAELVILENAGHGFITDAQEETGKAIMDFLRRHRASG